MRDLILGSLFTLFSCSLFGQATFNILDYGALPVSQNNAPAIQDAIDACNAQGGGTVVVPAGVFITGTIQLKSNVNLEVQSGAVLLGSLTLDDYPEIVNQSFRSMIDGGCQRSLIYAEQANNIKISGTGIINGNGSFPPFADADSKDRPFGVRLVSCHNVQLENVTMIESAFWMQHILNCDSVSITEVTIVNHGNSNNDGINLDCSTNAWIRGCNVDTSDDGIAIKSTGDKYTENVLVENCTLKTLSRGIKIGTESVGGFRNIVIRNTNCDASILSNPLVLPGQSGFSINSVDGADLDGLVIDNVSIRGYRHPILLRLGNRGSKPYAGAPDLGPGKFRNVVISNITATATDSIPSIISGLPGFPIENVSLENIHILSIGTHFGAGVPADSIPENPGSKPSYDMFGTDFPCKGFFIRHAKNISFNNVCITEVVPDSRPVFTLVDATINALDTTFGTVGDTSQVSCLVATLTGIEETVVSNEIAVYPNPANDQLTVIVADKGTLQFMDLSGRTVLTQSVSAGTQTINLAALSSGVYSLIIPGKSAPVKFIKQ